MGNVQEFATVKGRHRLKKQQHCGNFKPSRKKSSLSKYKHFSFFTVVQNAESNKRPFSRARRTYGAKTSGLIRPSMVGPALENGATVEGFMRFLEYSSLCDARLGAALKDAPTLYHTTIIHNDLLSRSLKYSTMYKHVDNLESPSSTSDLQDF